VLMMSSPNQISGELIIVDSMTGRETGALEQDVVDCFQEAGVVEPNAGTPLEHMCLDKRDAALRYLEERYHQRLRRDYSTIREVAEQLEARMKNVEQILKTKSKHQTVYTIGPDDSVLDALKLLAEKNIGALPVVENNQVIGIVSERDYARKLVLKGRSSAATPVREIMSAPVITVEPKHNLEYCMNQMTNLHLRHLPVVSNGELLGLLSIGDLVKETIAEQANLILQLEQYIRGE